MLFRLEDLFKPIEPWPGVDDPRPVLAEAQAELVAALQLVAANFTLMSGHVDKAPWADTLFDEHDRLAHQYIEAAQRAFQKFRLARDCSGSA